MNTFAFMTLPAAITQLLNCTSLPTPPPQVPPDPT
jgi:hypothetical protein